MIVTTTDGLEGQVIVEYKGLVSGTAIHGVNVGKDFKVLGANALVGASIDVEGVGTNTSMLLVTVSGTAVVVRPA
jgi:uncharacterized protein YbjQ (UPF0145 family)